MKALYILDPGIVGGATRAFKEFVVQLKKYDITPIVLTSTNSTLNEELNKLGIENHSIGHRTVLVQIWSKSWKRKIKYIVEYLKYRYCRFRAIKNVSKMVDLCSIDIIHTNSARNDIGCYISKRYNIPHICHIREFGDIDFNCISLNSNYINYYNKYTKVFIAISQAVKKHWEGKGIDTSKIRVVYDGVNPHDITRTSKENMFGEKIRIVIAGGVFPTKGQDIAVEAIGMLPIHIRNMVSLDIIGWYGESYIKKINFLIEKYNLFNNINILGPRNDVRSLYKNYQIGLMCSQNEGFGLVTAEYMHAGLGVIASNSGACPELIQDGVSGLLFEKGNAKILAEKIAVLFNDRHYLVSLAKNAQERANSFFTTDINSKKIIDIYKQINYGENFNNSYTDI